MAKSDIYMKEDRISVVGGDGREEVDGVERGDLEVTTKKGQTPDIRLNADWANVTVGGGSGRASEGDLKLLDREGNNRATITAESNNSPDDGTRAWMDGGRGRIELGEVDRHDIHVPRVWLDGSRGEVGIADDPRAPNQPAISLDAEDASITVGEYGVDGGSLSLHDQDSSVSLTSDADENGVKSELRLDDGNGFGGVRLHTTQPRDTSSYPAGTTELFDASGESSVELQGESATLRLGYSYVKEVNDGEFGAPVFVGKSGRILLDDGDASLLGDSSSVFEVRASEGSLEISNPNRKAPTFTLDPTGRLEITNDAGDAIFTVDPDDEVVEIPDTWSFKSGGDTILE